MYTSPLERFLRHFLFVWVIAVVLVVIFLFIFVSPLSPFHQCTLIGCRDALDLTISREPHSEYTIKLTSNTGETRSVTCTPGTVSASGPIDALCRTGIVTVYGFSPAEVTVQITWQGGSYMVTKRPEYTTLHPNGIFCPPSCRLGKISLELP